MFQIKCLVTSVFVFDYFWSLFGSQVFFYLAQCQTPCTPMSQWDGATKCYDIKSTSFNPSACGGLLGILGGGQPILKTQTEFDAFVQFLKQKYVVTWKNQVLSNNKIFSI